MPEILDIIFASLDSDALRAVIQVSRCWNEAGLSALWRHVTVTDLLSMPERLRPLYCNAVRSLDVSSAERRQELLGWRFPGLRALTFIFRTAYYRHEADADTLEAVLRASGPKLRYVHLGCSTALYTVATKDEYRPPRAMRSLLDAKSVQVLAERRGLTDLRIDLSLCPNSLPNARTAVTAPFADLRRLAVRVDREALKHLWPMIQSVWSLDIEPAWRFPILDVFAAPPPPPPPSSLLACAAVTDAKANNLTTLRLRYNVYWHSSRVTAADLRGVAALHRLQVLLIEVEERREWGLPPADNQVSPMLADADVLAMLDCLPDLRTLRLDIVGAFSAQLLPQTLQRCRLLEALSLFAPLDNALLEDMPPGAMVGLERLGLQGFTGPDVAYM
jgi:hypothetical protein